MALSLQNEQDSEQDQAFAINHNICSTNWLGALTKLLCRAGIFCWSGVLVLILLTLWQRSSLWPWLPLAVFLGSGGSGCLLLAWLRQGAWQRKLMQSCLVFMVLINAIACLGSYSFTHYDQFGFSNPKPQNERSPLALGLDYSTHRLPLSADRWLETWLIPASSPRGTVLLFPGNSGVKDHLLAPAQVFHKWHYNTLLVDFQGRGGSSGTATSIGFWEAQDVVAVVQDAQRYLQPPFILYGSSMGSAAILRAIAQENIHPQATILELPFAKLRTAVQRRFVAYHLPAFPLTDLAIFWGSLQRGFNGFAHNPVTYASQVRTPTLILQGQRDRWVPISEVQEIYRNLKGPKRLVLFPTAGHQVLVSVDPSRWEQNVQDFLNRLESANLS
jgi:uncharacterized protein